MPEQDNETHGFLYFLLGMAVVLSLIAAKNTFDIKWTLKNEMVMIQCR